MSKYGNKKITVNGETFDSKAEYNRYCKLVLLEKSGRIEDLRRQPKFELLTKQPGERALNYMNG